MPKIRDELAPAYLPEINHVAPIREWAEQERPREKLLAKGPAALSDAELVALVFGTGTATRRGPISALSLGQALLKSFGSLHQLSQRDVHELLRMEGIGPAKAAQLSATFELGRRTEASRSRTPAAQISRPADIYALFGPSLRDLKQEIFKIVLLNTAGRVLGDYNLTTGGLAASIVEPRQVFRRAVLENAASVICVHNHPSGNTEPSKEDINITRQLVEGGRLMGIPVHDHVIICGTTYTSLAERGLM